MNEELQWQAIQAQDASLDGQFVYGVITTGVYCRPSCNSRKPLRKNIRFYASPAAAEHDGLRACKRCRPNSLSAHAAIAQRMNELCRYIEVHADETLSLNELGRQAHMSPQHLQRRFKTLIGVTPKQYAVGCRLRALKHGLRASETVTGAIYDAGFGSTSRVYERAVTRIGMTPKQYRAGGQGVAISYASANTPLGLLMMAATDRGLCFVQLGDDEQSMRERLAGEYPAATLTPMPASAKSAFRQWMRSLCDYLEDARSQLDLPIDIRGTAFQMKVWDYLRGIPSGEIRSYKEVAEAVGRPKAIRAVANACAANPVALTIPCHRVIRGDGGLGGYRWGIERKRVLIDCERALRAATA